MGESRNMVKINNIGDGYTGEQVSAIRQVLGKVIGDSDLPEKGTSRS